MPVDVSQAWRQVVKFGGGVFDLCAKGNRYPISIQAVSTLLCRKYGGRSLIDVIEFLGRALGLSFWLILDNAKIETNCLQIHFGKSPIFWWPNLQLEAG